MSKTRYLQFFTAGFWVAFALAVAGAEVETPRPTAFARLGYLPATGPSPLRFLAVAPRVAVFMPLPPEPAKAESVPTPPNSEPTDAADSFALTDLLAPAADSGTNVMEAISPPPAEPTSREAPISPQLFLKYFNGGTNGGGAGSPVEFTPPPTGAPGRPKASAAPSVP